MPTNSDYLEPCDSERESRLVCDLLIYVGKGLKLTLPSWVKEGTKSIYGDLKHFGEAKKLLRLTCKSMTKKQQDELIYDAHSRMARKLADWYEGDNEKERAAIEEQLDTARRQLLRKKALSKLTKEEKEALDL